eukprot:g29944.t1
MSSRVRPQPPPPPPPAGGGRFTPAAGPRVQETEQLEMRRIRAPASASSAASRQAWSRENPGYEPGDEELDWAGISPGRQSVSSSGTGGSEPRGEASPVPEDQPQQQVRAALPHSLLQKAR